MRPLPPQVSLADPLARYGLVDQHLIGSLASAVMRLLRYDSASQAIGLPQMVAALDVVVVIASTEPGASSLIEAGGIEVIHCSLRTGISPDAV